MMGFRWFSIFQKKCLAHLPFGVVRSGSIFLTDQKDPMTDPAPTQPSLKDRFSSALGRVWGYVRGRHSAFGWTRGPKVVESLGRRMDRIGRLFDRLEAGEVFAPLKPRTRKPRTETQEEAPGSAVGEQQAHDPAHQQQTQTPNSVRLPGYFHWLRLEMEKGCVGRLDWENVDWFINEFDDTVRDPRLPALDAASGGRLGRELRGYCNMFGIRPPECLRRPPRARRPRGPAAAARCRQRRAAAQAARHAAAHAAKAAVVQEAARAAARTADSPSSHLSILGAHPAVSCLPHHDPNDYMLRLSNKTGHRR